MIDSDANNREVPRGGGSSLRHPSPARDTVGLGSLWFGLAGGAFAWSALTIVIYAIAAQACYPRMVPLATPTTGNERFIVSLIVISCVAIILAVAAGLVSIRNWRRAKAETGGGTHWALDTGEGRTRFMAVSSLMTSAVFLLAIIVDVVSIVVVHPCW